MKKIDELELKVKKANDMESSRKTAIYEAKRQEEFIEKTKHIIKELELKKGRKLKACVTTFGCQMNERDSEKLKGILQACGYDLVETEDADLVLYNTCTVRENANLKLYGRLGALNRKKKKNSDMIIGICGCMPQEEEVVEKLQTSYHFVDIIFGTFNVFKLAEILYSRFTSGNHVIDIWESNDSFVELLPTERKYTFKSGVNIMYGCDNFCTYCIVPYVRGRENSRDPEDIVDEIKRLVDSGVVEVMLLGQNVNSYGKNLNKDITFTELLKKIEQIDGLKRIRFMTPHPKDFSDDLIELCAQSSKICKHIHLPVQSGSSRILKKMNRQYTKEDYLALVEKIKAAIPDVSLTADIIVGFPGETEEDFLETLDVVTKVAYDSAFTFIYSKRSGTPAASMEDLPSEEVVKDRFDRLLVAIREASRDKAGFLVGSRQEVLVESVNDHDKTLMTGRLSNNMLVHFPGDANLVGQIINVDIEESKGFYYFGKQSENF